ncbi:MAG: IS3 family transposase [Nocardiaceae bacterium]|nr:IS3 family transposase [Nocardiaceae bacterium]
MAIDAHQDPARATGAIRPVAEQLGIHPEALRTWFGKLRSTAAPGRVRAATTRDESPSLNARIANSRAPTKFCVTRKRFRGSGARPQTEVIVAYIDEHKDREVDGRRLGVEPICTVLRTAGVQIAPSTYYAAQTRESSARAVRNAELLPIICRVHSENLGVFGARKVDKQLRRQGHEVARCTVERLMKGEGLQGITREKTRRTTISHEPETPRPADLAKRQFTATAPDLLWVADLTYIRTHAGWVYAAFILDVFFRMITGWQVSTSVRTDLALGALDMGLWARKRAGHDLAGLVHHSHRIVQYRAIRYTEGLAESEAAGFGWQQRRFVGQRDGEALSALFKAELIRNPAARTCRRLEDHRRRRDRRRRIHRLVQFTDVCTARSDSSRLPSSKPTTGRTRQTPTTLKHRS